MVRHAIHAVPRADKLVHVKIFSPPIWQSIPCDRVGKLHEDRKDLAYQGLTFVPPDGDSCLLDQGANILEESFFLFPLIATQVPPYDEALNWLKLSYTGERMGS